MNSKPVCPTKKTQYHIRSTPVEQLQHRMLKTEVENFAFLLGHVLSLTKTKLDVSKQYCVDQDTNSTQS